MTGRPKRARKPSLLMELIRRAVATAPGSDAACRPPLFVQSRPRHTFLAAC